MTIALYPGSFDPVTFGHLDIATRSATVFDEVVMGVFDTPQKNLRFTTEERVSLIQRSIENIPNVRVTSYSAMTVDFAKRLGAKVIVRGLYQ